MNVPAPRALALFVCGALIVFSWGIGARSQERVGNPHLPGPDALPRLDEYLAFDDMRLRPEQHAELFRAPASRSQAFPSSYGRRLGAWDAGVVPYVIAPNYTDVERQRFLDAMTAWSRVAPVVFVPRTTQRGFLAITKDLESANGATTCWATVGQTGRATAGRMNMPGCVSPHQIVHETGHSLGLQHEHQRPDRDDYVTIDFANIPQNLHFAFSKWQGFPLVGPYDFGSVMHYPARTYTIDSTRNNIIPHAPYQGWTASMGTATVPSDNDHNVMALFYYSQLRESDIRFPTESTRTRFESEDLQVAMERLHAFYMSRMGLHRPQGLSIDGRPDFLGIAQWIFDIYLAARSGGFSSEGAFDIVTASITRTEEWRQKNPGRAPLTPTSFRGVLSFSRDEFLDVLNRLDRFYAAPEGLQRPNGLSIAGGPDFQGIATWIFDIYLNQRLAGASPNAAWQLTENAIRATDEWRSKH